MHIVSLHGKWKSCLGEAKTARNRYQNSSSLQDLEAPKEDPNSLISLFQNDEDLSHNSTQDTTVDLEKCNNVMTLENKSSKQPSEESGSNLRLNNSEEIENRLRVLEGKGSSHSEIGTDCATKVSQKGGSLDRPQRSNSCETGRRSKGASPQSKSSKRKTTRSNSREGSRTTRANSHDGNCESSGKTKATTMTDQPNQASTDESLPVTRGISRSNSNSQARTESGQKAFLDTSQQKPGHQKPTAHSQSRDLHEELYRLFGNTADATVASGPVESSVSATSSTRRMPKGGHETLAAPAQSSQKGSNPSKKKGVIRKVSKASESSQSTSRTSSTTSSTENKGCDELDCNASSTSLSASKPASERTDCSYGSLPLKDASKPGDPPAKRPQRYRRLKQHQPTRESQPPPRSAGPKVVETPSNRFLQVAKDASSVLPSAPQRCQSPSSAHKKKAPIPRGGGGAETTTNSNPEHRGQHSHNPKPFRSIDEDKINESKGTTKKKQAKVTDKSSSLSTRTSHSASDTQRSRRWESSADKSSTAPRPPKSIALDIFKPSIITNFDPNEWDTDDDSDIDDDDQSMAAASV